MPKVEFNTMQDVEQDMGPGVVEAPNKEMDYLEGLDNAPQDEILPQADIEAPKNDSISSAVGIAPPADHTPAQSATYPQPAVSESAPIKDGENEKNLVTLDLDQNFYRISVKDVKNHVYKDDFCIQKIQEILNGLPHSDGIQKGDLEKFKKEPIMFMQNMSQEIKFPFAVAVSIQDFIKRVVDIDEAITEAKKQSKQKELAQAQQQQGAGQDGGGSGSAAVDGIAGVIGSTLRHTGSLIKHLAGLGSSLIRKKTAAPSTPVFGDESPAPEGKTALAALKHFAQTDVSNWDASHMKDCLTGVNRAMEGNLADDKDFHRDAEATITDIHDKAETASQNSPEEKKRLEEIVKMTKRIIEMIKSFFAKITGTLDGSSHSGIKGPSL